MQWMVENESRDSSVPRFVVERDHGVEELEAAGNMGCLHRWKWRLLTSSAHGPSGSLRSSSPKMPLKIRTDSVSVRGPSPTIIA